MRKACVRVKVFHIHNLATNEKCINNLSIDFSPGSLIETTLNLSQVYKQLELLYTLRRISDGSFSPIRRCISKFSYLYNSERFKLAKFGLQGLKSIDRLFIHCDLSLGS